MSLTGQENVKMSISYMLWIRLIPFSLSYSFHARVDSILSYFHDSKLSRYSHRGWASFSPRRPCR